MPVKITASKKFDLFPMKLLIPIDLLNLFGSRSAGSKLTYLVRLSAGVQGLAQVIRALEIQNGIADHDAVFLVLPDELTS